MPPSITSYSSISAFHAKLAQSKRILAVCGAGLSAASGLPTFRGAGGLWRNHDAMTLATPEAFEADPGLVWMFYAYRRHMALKAKPNPAHYALAELARRRPGFMCLSQNVDNLHVRASHPSSQLKLLHGSLFAIKCTECSWTDPNNTLDPFCPSLAPASDDSPSPALLDPKNPLAHVPREELPRCPECKTGLQRPGVVWFGEALDEQMLRDIDEWIAREQVDMVLVIGTSGTVWPAAGFAEQARSGGGKGGKKQGGTTTSVVTVNMELDGGRGYLSKNDFGFEGDAGELLPKLLEPVIGRMVQGGENGEGEVRWEGGDCSA